MTISAAIMQPNYIPWRGYFDLISRVDKFVFFDDVQYTTKDWRNRNKIKTKEGDLWLTVPVKTTGRTGQLISEVEIDNSTEWQNKHFNSIVWNYRKAPYFKSYEGLLESIYLSKRWELLVELNIESTKLICQTLDINVEWYRSSELSVCGDKNGERAINICQKIGADSFINGPTARAFIDEELFNKNKVKNQYIEYKYQNYSQQFDNFSPSVTILDVLFNCGADSRKMISAI
jgi:WbqC-like protein family